MGCVSWREDLALEVATRLKEKLSPFMDQMSRPSKEVLIRQIVQALILLEVLA